MHSGSEREELSVKQTFGQKKMCGKWENGLTNAWVGRQKDSWIDAYISKYICIRKYTSGCEEGWMDGQMDRGNEGQITNDRSK